MSGTLTFLLHLSQWGILAYFVLLNFTHLLLIVRAAHAIRRYQETEEVDQIQDFFETIHLKPITIVCPVHDEGEGAVHAVNSLLGLRYPEYQVVVVNDGSTDDTLERLVAFFHLKPARHVTRMVLPTASIRGFYENPSLPKLLVVDKENGGKSDALNCGLNLARFPLVCCMDGDSILEDDALLKVTRPFLDKPNVVATAGVIRPLNGCKVTPRGIRGIFMPDNWLARFQVVEYLRSFLFGRMGLSGLGSMFIVSGAFGVFRRDILLEIGGFSRTVGEDFEIVVRLHRHIKAKGLPCSVVMVPDPVCWTEVPEDALTLRRQRNRWQRGLLDTLWLHKGMMLNGDFGLIGLFSMPYFLLFEAAAPVVEAIGYVVFGLAILEGKTHLSFGLAFFFVALLLGIFNSQVAILLEQITNHPYQRVRDWALLMFCGILENFGFRQRTVLWRLLGTLDWVLGRQEWGAMRRKRT